MTKADDAACAYLIEQALAEKDALIRELVAALWQADGVIRGLWGPQPINIRSDIAAALDRAKAAGYEP